MSKIKKHFDKILLGLIILFLCLRNYNLGTYLIGWDNLMPELNIFLNIKRSLNSVWQYYQGLGLVGGMAHSTDLIRQLIILPFTLILPTSLIRYLYHFTTLFIGTFGIYFGLQKYFKNSRSIYFIASLFYLLNFGTIQNYWPPFEPFSTFFAFFPWLVFPLLNYLDQPNKSKLKKLIIINILAIPSFYVQTIFLVYLFTLASILIPYLIFHQQQFKIKIKKTFFLGILIFCLNAFWLLPFAYFLKNDVANTQLGIGNLMASEETIHRNEFRGNISDFLILRGYYYDFPFAGGLLMSSWSKHFSSPFILLLTYSLSAIVLLGLVTLIIKKTKNYKKIGLLSLLFICAIALLSATPPFNFINHLTRQISILNQVFRSPFTKFIIPASFCFTLLFAFGLRFIEKSKLKIKKIIYTLIIIIIFISSYPAFKGNYIYPSMRQKIPSSYTQLINFFKSKPKNSRIANLPSGSYWGWTNYRHGITGSGFLWYGIEQPILDRAFDVWSLKNEQYYWELNYAIQKQDKNLLNQIIEKYFISYIIFDNDVIYPDEPIYGSNAIRTREMLKNMDNLTLESQFDNIYIYKTNFDTSPKIIYNPQNIKQNNFFYQDIAFNNHHHYISSSNPQIIYPFANLFTNRLQNEIPFNIRTENNTLFIDDIPFPIYQTYSFSNPIQSDLNSKIDNPKNSQEIITENQNFIRLKSSSINNLLGKYFPDISYDNSYLIKITYRHINNYPLIVSAFGEQSKQTFFTTKLEKNKDWQTAWFVIPKHKNNDFDKSLTILFNNTTFNKKTSINDIKDIEIYQIPYGEIINTKIISDQKHQNISFLLHPQAYHPGWIAFYLDGYKPVFLKDHVLVNNWANGWQLPVTYDLQSKVYYLFWPQLLQYLGFILGLYALFQSINKPHSKHSR